MLQSQLQFERHRREVHAERNRRLLAKAKGVRLVEEELHTMRLQLVQAQNEMTAVRRDADAMRRFRNTAEAERSQAVLQFEELTRKMLQEVQDLTAAKCQREEELAAARDEVRSLRREADRLHAQSFAVKAEMNELRRQANESRRFQQDLKDSQYHLIAARETANLLQQQLMNPSGSVLKYEMEEMTRAYKGKKKMELDRSRREVNGCNETEIVSTVEKWRNRKTFNIYFFFGDRNRGRCALFTEILISIGQQNVSVPCGFSIGQCFRYDSELICDGLHICRFDLCIAEELKAHWEKLERERRQNEALASKLADMEAMASRRETDISELKRTLQLVKEEHQQVMQVTTKRPFLRGLGWIGNSRRPSDESRSTCHR